MSKNTLNFLICSTQTHKGFGIWEDWLCRKHMNWFKSIFKLCNCQTPKMNRSGLHLRTPSTGKMPKSTNNFTCLIWSVESTSISSNLKNKNTTIHGAQMLSCSEIKFPNWFQNSDPIETSRSCWYRIIIIYGLRWKLLWSKMQLLSK